MVMKDPIGYYAALIRQSLNFPAAAWRQAISDAKQVRLVKNF
jgi:hypothetical protein